MSPIIAFKTSGDVIGHQAQRMLDTLAPASFQAELTNK